MGIYRIFDGFELTFQSHSTMQMKRLQFIDILYHDKDVSYLNTVWHLYMIYGVTFWCGFMLFLGIPSSSKGQSVGKWKCYWKEIQVRFICVPLLDSIFCLCRSTPFLSRVNELYMQLYSWVSLSIKIYHNLYYEHVRIKWYRNSECIYLLSHEYQSKYFVYQIFHISVNDYILIKNIWYCEIKTVIIWEELLL